MADFDTITMSPQQYAWDYDVPCVVCGRRFRVITGTHLRTHGLTTAEYAERFPNAPMACREVGESIRRTHSGVEKSPEHRAKLAAHLKTLPPPKWSEEARRKVSDSLTGREFSDEHKARIGAATRRQWANGERQQPFTPQWEKDAAAWLVEAGVEFHHQYNIPGFSHPYDFHLPGRNLLIELDGCFWHGCECQGGPSNHYIEANVKRDRETERIAANFGYRLVRIRECEFSREQFMGVING